MSMKFTVVLLTLLGALTLAQRLVSPKGISDWKIFKLVPLDLETKDLTSDVPQFMPPTEDLSSFGVRSHVKDPYVKTGSDDSSDSAEVTPLTAVCLPCPCHSMDRYGLRLLPDRTLELGNLTVDVDKPLWEHLIMVFYDLALARIRATPSPRERIVCFRSLNHQMYRMITDVISQSRRPSSGYGIPILKLQILTRHCANQPFTESCTPPADRKKPENKPEVQCPLPVSTPAPSIIVLVKDGTELTVDKGSGSYYVDARKYAEHGCFDLFERRVEQGIGYFRDVGPLDVSVPVLSSSDTYLEFPDGTRMKVRKDDVAGMLLAFYNCKMLEIASLPRASVRKCYRRMFHRNMELFLKNLMEEKEHDDWFHGDHLKWLLERVQNDGPEVTKPEPDVMYHTSAIATVNRNRSTTVQSSRPVRLTTLRSMASWSTSATLNTKRTQPFMMRGKILPVSHKGIDKQEVASESLDDLVGLKTHVAHGVCIILGSVFLMLTFLAAFIMWLCYWTRKLKMEQLLNTTSTSAE